MVVTGSGVWVFFSLEWLTDDGALGAMERKKWNSTRPGKRLLFPLMAW